MANPDHILLHHILLRSVNYPHCISEHVNAQKITNGERIGTCRVVCPCLKSVGDVTHQNIPGGGGNSYIKRTGVELIGL